MNAYDFIAVVAVLVGAPILALVIAALFYHVIGLMAPSASIKNVRLVSWMLGAGLVLYMVILSLATGANACEQSHGFMSASVERKLNGDWIGDYPATFRLGYRYHFAPGFYVGPVLAHHSNWEKGWPREYERETWNNTLGIELEGRF